MVSPTTTAPPPEFICPLTKEIMRHPMISRHNIHYDRSAILAYLQQGHSICPVTQKPLRLSDLVTDTKLWKQIQEYGTSTTVEEQQDDDDDDHVFVACCTMIPARFLCPLTHQIMTDPVMTKKGQNFERSAILNHLDQVGCICPVTKTPLYPSGLVSNHTLQWEIQQYELYHGDNRKASMTVTMPTTTSLLEAAMPHADDRTLAALSDWGSPFDLSDLLDQVLDTIEQ